MKLIDHFINGKSPNFSGLSSTPVFNPASGEETSRVVSGTAECINKAVNSAKEIFPEWSATTPLVRARKMFKLKELIEFRQNELAKLISLEHGKTLMMRLVKLVEDWKLLSLHVEYQIILLVITPVMLVDLLIVGLIISRWAFVRA